MEIRSKFPDLERISIIPHSSIAKPIATQSTSFRRWISVPDILHQHRQQQQQQQNQKREQGK
jgi:hypothetical protein